MQDHRRDASAPDVASGSAGPVPEMVPPPEKPKRSRWPWLAATLILLIAGGLYWQLRPTGADPEAAGTAVAQLPTAKVETRGLQQTIRLTGTTQAERFASLIAPRLRGSRSGRGRTRSGGNLIQTKSTITVASTSSISRSSISSSLSATGTVASTGNTGGGGFSGAPRSGSSAMKASTSRVGGSSSGSSGSNISSSGGGGSGAMGSSGLGSTSTSIPGGGGGGSRRRGDFHMALHKLIEPGTEVKKGDVIAEFDRQYMLTRLEDYKSSVMQVEASFEKGIADLAVTRKAHRQSILSAKGSLERAELDIKAIPVLSEIDSERLRLAREEAEAEHKQLLSEVKYVDISEQSQLRTAKLEVQQAQVELRRNTDNVDKLLIKAPIDGMVVMLNVFSNGEFRQVREGDELHGGQPFIRVVDNSSMVIETSVNQVDVEKMRIGQKAVVHFDAFPDLSLPARVFSIGTVAKARQYRREYVTEIPVKLKLDKVDPRVIPDLSASADVIVETAEQVTVAPLGAVFSDPGDGSSYVFVQHASGWEKREVELGIKNSIAAEVLSGLKTGEVIALQRPAAAVSEK